MAETEKWHAQDRLELANWSKRDTLSLVALLSLEARRLDSLDLTITEWPHTSITQNFPNDMRLSQVILSFLVKANHSLLGSRYVQMNIVLPFMAARFNNIILDLQTGLPLVSLKMLGVLDKISLHLTDVHSVQYDGSWKDLETVFWSGRASFLDCPEIRAVVRTEIWRRRILQGIPNPSLTAEPFTDPHFAPKITSLVPNGVTPGLTADVNSAPASEIQILKPLQHPVQAPAVCVPNLPMNFPLDIQISPLLQQPLETNNSLEPVVYEPADLPLYPSHSFKFYTLTHHPESIPRKRVKIDAGPVFEEDSDVECVVRPGLPRVYNIPPIGRMHNLQLRQDLLEFYENKEEGYEDEPLCEHDMLIRAYINRRRRKKLSVQRRLHRIREEKRRKVAEEEENQRLESIRLEEDIRRKEEANTKRKHTLLKKIREKEEKRQRLKEAKEKKRREREMFALEEVVVSESDDATGDFSNSYNDESIAIDSTGGELSQMSGDGSDESSRPLPTPPPKARRSGRIREIESMDVIDLDSASDSVESDPDNKPSKRKRSESGTLPSVNDDTSESESGKYDRRSSRRTYKRAARTGEVNYTIPPLDSFESESDSQSGEKEEDLQSLRRTTRIRNAVNYKISEPDSLMESQGDSDSQSDESGSSGSSEEDHPKNHRNTKRRPITLRKDDHQTSHRDTKSRNRNTNINYQIPEFDTFEESESEESGKDGTTSQSTTKHTTPRLQLFNSLGEPPMDPNSQSQEKKKDVPISRTMGVNHTTRRLVTFEEPEDDSDQSDDNGANGTDKTTAVTHTYAGLGKTEDDPIDLDSDSSDASSISNSTGSSSPLKSQMRPIRRSRPTPSPSIPAVDESDDDVIRTGRLRKDAGSNKRAVSKYLSIFESDQEEEILDSNVDLQIESGDEDEDEDDQLFLKPTQRRRKKTGTQLLKDFYDISSGVGNYNNIDSEDDTPRKATGRRNRNIVQSDESDESDGAHDFSVPKRRTRSNDVTEPNDSDAGYSGAANRVESYSKRSPRRERPKRGLPPVTYHHEYITSGSDSGDQSSDEEMESDSSNPSDDTREKIAKEYEKRIADFISTQNQRLEKKKKNKKERISGNKSDLVKFFIADASHVIKRVHFQMPRNKPFESLFKKYASATKLKLGTLMFKFEEEKVQGKLTPEHYDIQDGDVIIMSTR